MKICLFTPTFLPAVGGTETVTDILARQLQRAGHEPVVLTPGRPAPLKLPYTVRWYAKPLGSRLFPELHARALRQAHEEFKFDIWCVNYGNPTGYGAVRLGKRLGVPVVVVSHGGDLYVDGGDRRRPRIWQRVVIAYREADALVAISPYLQELIAGVAPEHKDVTLIPNGIDISGITEPAARPADFTDTRPFCLCLGNLGRFKGFDDAIAAFAARRSDLGGMVMVIVGDGPLEAQLKAQAKEMGVGNEVIFTGRRVGNDKRWFLQNCRFGLMPSLEEGHPLVGIEFLASGKPLICTTNRAFDGMYDEGVNAIRVTARDRQKLGEAMVKMNAMDLAALGRASLSRAPRFDAQAMAESYIQLFNRLRAER